MALQQAPWPFDKQNADIILHSADGFAFRVYSQILCMASPVFEDMFAMAVPHDVSMPADQGPPVVPLAEENDVLDPLLRLCYPIEKLGRPRDLADIPPLLKAALKYMMPLPVSILTKELLAYAKDRPLQVWAIGCQLGLEDVAHAGARGAAHLKELGTYNELREFVPVEDFLPHALGISAGDYFRLIQFHRLGGTVPASFTLTRPAARSQDAQRSRASGPLSPIDRFFTSLPFPDIICRASDGAEFPSHKALLCICSPILSKRLTRATHLESAESSTSGSVPSDTSLPSIDFVEDSAVLAVLLRHCYPGDHPLPDDISSSLALVEAAESYGMTHIVTSIKSRWTSIVAQAPLSAYFAAAAAGFQQEARVAARLALEVQLGEEYVLEMENSSAQVYQRLLAYQKRARELAMRVAQASIWKADGIRDTAKAASPSAVQSKKRNNRSKAASHTGEDACGGGCQGFRGRSWLQERRATYLQLLSDHPGKPFVLEADLLVSSAAFSLGEKPWCACCLNVAADIVHLGRGLPARISSELDKLAFDG
ncbi:hypothetical protein OH77DRAFT_804350 [Trametes cingulata]|nr:hypothetical protein OH77DRAFT_804350 [Trametes cingulata]